MRQEAKALTQDEEKQMKYSLNALITATDGSISKIGSINSINEFYFIDLMQWTENSLFKYPELHKALIKFSKRLLARFSVKENQITLASIPEDNLIKNFLQKLKQITKISSPEYSRNLPQRAAPLFAAIIESSKIYNSIHDKILFIRTNQNLLYDINSMSAELWAGKNKNSENLCIYIKKILIAISYIDAFIMLFSDKPAQDRLNLSPSYKTLDDSLTDVMQAIIHCRNNQSMPGLLEIREALQQAYITATAQLTNLQSKSSSMVEEENLEKKGKPTTQKRPRPPEQTPTDLNHQDKKPKTSSNPNSMLNSQSQTQTQSPTRMEIDSTDNDANPTTQFQ